MLASTHDLDLGLAGMTSSGEQALVAQACLGQQVGMCMTPRWHVKGAACILVECAWDDDLHVAKWQTAPESFPECEVRALESND